VRWKFTAYTLAFLLLSGDIAGEDYATNQEEQGIPSTLARVETS
jgi:hypothetical protein